MSTRPPIELINRAAEQLGDLVGDVVFLGGAVVGLLLSDRGGPPVRATRDVDVAIELGPRFLDQHALDRRLLELGFKNDMHGPTCRYLHEFTVIDVIPVGSEKDEENPWYRLALDSSWEHLLANHVRINVISPACFLGTKVAAFRSPEREYHDDIFLSRDFEDLVRVIDGRPEVVAEVESGDALLRAYLQSELRQILRKEFLVEAVQEIVESGRENLTIQRMNSLAGEV